MWLMGKGLSHRGGWGAEKNGGLNSEDSAIYVIENKCRKNVTFWLCHHIYENKRLISFLPLYLWKQMGLAKIAGRNRERACAGDRDGFVASTASAVGWKARRTQSGLAPERVGSTRARDRGEKARGESASTLRDVKNEGTSGDVYDNKDQSTFCPAQKRHFCVVEGHFTREYTYFAETSGSFAIIRALRSELFAS